MIKIWTEEDSKKINKDFFSKEELKMLEIINIRDNECIKETALKINNHLIKKYKLRGGFEIEDTNLSKEDIILYNLYKKISDSLNNL